MNREHELREAVKDGINGIKRMAIHALAVKSDEERNTAMVELFTGLNEVGLIFDETVQAYCKLEEQLNAQNN